MSWTDDQLTEIFPTYTTFLAISQHFSNSSYDYFKYHGKVRANKESLRKNRGLKAYRSLHQKHGHHIKPFLIAMFMEDNTTSVFDCIRPNADKVYKKWQQNIEHIQDIVYDDLKQKCLYHKPKKITDLLKPNGNDNPPLLEDFYSGGAHILTMVAVDQAFGIVQLWDKLFDEDFIWDSYRHVIIGARGFFSFNKEQTLNTFKQIHLEMKNG
ncbi:MAG: hypothetical protein KAS32_23500 [Candidatus Peribacteraceae bacterium]|nr:hypothetical protein [Candidatus Peribacteraceae bacterium]